MTGTVQDNLETVDLLPGEHDVDSGYISADLLVSSRQRGITLLGPLLADNSAQARADGYTAAMFTIDFDRKQATCPEGAVSPRGVHRQSRGPGDRRVPGPSLGRKRYQPQEHVAICLITSAKPSKSDGFTM